MTWSYPHSAYVVGSEKKLPTLPHRRKISYLIPIFLSKRAKNPGCSSVCLGFA